VRRDGLARRLAVGALLALAVPRLALAAAAAAFTADLSALELAPSPSAPLELVVNGGVHDPVQVVLREGDAFVAVADLEAAGLRGFAGRRESIDGRPCVSLGSLAPALTYVVDEHDLALRVTAPPELLLGTIGDLGQNPRPPGLEVRGDPSAFLNYSVQHRSDGTTSGFLEGGASQGGRLLYGSGQLLQDGRTIRGLTNLTFDDPGSLRRLVVGDAFAASTGLGGGLLLGGLSLVREYGLDPYQVHSPRPRLSGFAPTPSVLDVYVDGRLVRQVPVSPGAYDLTNLPVTAGAGNVETVLRDPFGRTEVLSWQYYYTAGLLTPGLSDYGYSAGLRRSGFGRTSNAYGRPVFVGRHRFGVLDALSLGGRLDAAADLVSGGPSATIGLPFGTLDLEAAASAESGRGGAAGSAAYSFISRRFSGGALLRLMSDRYAHAALRSDEDRPRAQSNLFLGATLSSRVSSGITWSLQDRREAGTSQILTARTDLQVSRGLTLGLSGSRSWNPGSLAGYEAFANLSWTFAQRAIADVSVQTVQGGARALSAGVQQSLPAGTGFGYRARTGTDLGGENTTALLQAQWDHGRYEVEYDRIGALRTETATVAGGAVFIGSRVFLTRPVEQGYGLLRTGVPDVRGYAEGQEIGRTDRNGDLFVPRLLPYYGNRVAIADQDVPVEYQIGASERIVGPALRGGVVARFDIALLRATHGELVAAAAGAVDAPPAYGDVRVHVGALAVSSPIGADGRFYLEGLPAGAHRAEVEWTGGRCVATIVVPEAPAMADVGRLRCEPEPTLVAKPEAPEAPAVPASPVPAAAPTAEVPAALDGPPRSAGPASTDPVALSTAAPAHAAPSAIPTAPLPRPTPRGFGPESPVCPSCALCSSVPLRREATPTAQLRCLRDLTVMRPAQSRAAAKDACLATSDWERLCAECIRVREERRCTTWPETWPEAQLPPSSRPARAPAAADASQRAPRQWEIQRKLRGGRRFVLEDVEFAGRSPVLVREEGLAELARALAALPGVRVRLEVFVDGTEDPSEDVRAAMAQAMAVVRRLVSLGVARERIAQQALGGVQPVVPNFTARGRAANRRVEVIAVPP
jgi:outer membrane usher protein